MQRICLACNKTFEARDRQRLYCSRPCYWDERGRAKRITKHCPGCGQSFTVLARQKARKYCSYACSVKDRSRPNWHQYDVRVCKNCMEEFTVISWSRNVFCTHKCSTDFRRGMPNLARRVKERRPVKPRARRIRDGNGKLIFIHRFRMQEHLGRPLVKQEVVHHIDCDPSNNAIENLCLYANESVHQVAHRAVEALIKPLMQAGVLEFIDGRYALAVTYEGRNEKGIE